jgi:hypothetical protein
MCLGLSAHAFSMTDSELGTSMQKDIQKYMITLKSPKMVFHWVDASDVSPQGQYNSKFPSTASHYKAYVDKQGKKIFNKRNPSDRDIAGPGLYLASNPVSSRSYGGEKSFGLIVGVIKPGARLVAGAYGGLVIDGKLILEINARGCMQADYINILNTTDANCTKVKQLLVGKDVSFAEGRIYQWSSQRMAGCSDVKTARDLNVPKSIQNAGLNLDTFVAYNSNMLSDIRGYTHKSSKSGDALGDSILSYLKGMVKEGLSTNMVSADQFNDASIKAMTKSEIEKFNQKNILGCVR